MASQNYNDTQAVRQNRRCDALVKRGTGVAYCDRPLDEHGNCDRAGAHTEGA